MSFPGQMLIGAVLPPRDLGQFSITISEGGGSADKLILKLWRAIINALQLILPRYIRTKQYIFQLAN